MKLLKDRSLRPLTEHLQWSTNAERWTIHATNLRQSLCFPVLAECCWWFSLMFSISSTQPLPWEDFDSTGCYVQVSPTDHTSTVLVPWFWTTSMLRLGHSVEPSCDRIWAVVFNSASELTNNNIRMDLCDWSRRRFRSFTKMQTVIYRKVVVWWRVGYQQPGQSHGRL